MSDLRTITKNMNYNYGPLVTPYQKPGQSWDEPIGKWHHIAAKWRLVFAVQAVIIVVLSAFLVLLTMDQKVKVWVSEVLPQGYVLQVGTLNPLPQQNKILFHDFIHRYLSSEHFAKMYTQKVGSDAFMPDLKWLQHTRGSYQLTQTGPNQFVVHWDDKNAGRQLEMTLVTRELSEQSQLLENPLGFYVVGLKWLKG